MTAHPGDAQVTPRLPTCEEVLTVLWAYLDGELEEGKRQEVDYHLSLCRSCTAYLETYKTTIALERASARAEGTPVEELPEELVQAILAAVRPPRD